MSFHIALIIQMALLIIAILRVGTHVRDLADLIATINGAKRRGHSSSNPPVEP